MNMSVDREKLEEFKQRLADRYTAYELVELLGIDVWRILEEFEDEVMEMECEA